MPPRAPGPPPPDRPFPSPRRARASVASTRRAGGRPRPRRAPPMPTGRRRRASRTSCQGLGVDVDGANLDGAMMNRGNPRGPVERVVEGRAVENEEAPERLLHPGVAPVGDDALIVAEAD